MEQTPFESYSPRRPSIAPSRDHERDGPAPPPERGRRVVTEGFVR
ncbi:MAG: hypothetical protein AVDCRST_MAG33-1217 [uncultured Thermomicrobiales bacterium]|uniref:Uncharacterized protein n=1 Tax=uncultured Thermomicrobiales bacterium TaxID=1645740 RepID=A0A6J4UMR6_9BACT|nr:MAG: hypothetical protein AVDCRST_MAG33-1217 [uncultured Thermomicrobiales bacterium]